MNIRDIVYLALFAGLTAALGLLPPMMIPFLGVPITAQSLGPMLAGGLIGSKKGALSMVLFIVFVLIGFPFLAGGRGGLMILAGPTGGFLLGWIPAAWVIGFFLRFRERPKFVFTCAVCMVGGIFVLYPIGILWMALITSLPIFKIVWGVMVFIPGDLIKAVTASAVIVKVLPVLVSLNPSLKKRCDV